jgi:hypothetical protein
MEEYFWLFKRDEHKALTGSILFSLLFHSLMVAVLSTTTIFHPPIGAAEKLDIMWFYPSAPSGWRTVPVEKVAIALAKAPGVVRGVNQKTAGPLSERVEPTQTAPAGAIKVDQGTGWKSPHPSSSEAAPVKTIAAVPAAEEKEPENDPEMKLPAAVEQLPEVKGVEIAPERSPIGEAASAETKTKVLIEPEKKAGKQRKQLPQITPGTLLTAPTSPAKPIKREERTMTNVAAVPALQPLAVTGETKEGKARKEVTSDPAAKTSPVAKREDEPLPNPAESKGLFLPPVKGDLKLEIIGRDELLKRIKVIVLFRDFPKARRNRPWSRVEYRRFLTLTPKMVRGGDETLQAVIEVAQEGIYEFRVETGSGGQVEAAFAVKLHDNGGSARTSPVGKRSIANSESIVKVLMPEGILWDDDPAFSGSMEDSESITKFNSENGLVWREYK